MISQYKLKEWVDKYLQHIAEITPETHVNQKEGYKFKAVDIFQRNFNIEAVDFAAMLDASIVNNNLVTGSWYFPRKMLLIFAKESPNETRAIFRSLFNETQPIVERIDSAEAGFNHMMDARNDRLKEELHSFIGVRFLSLLLGYRYPEVHDALKPREWKIFCAFIDPDFKSPQGISRGNQYELFAPRIEALRQYAITLPEIQDIKRRFTAGLSFQDDEFRWMTQDIIYTTALHLIEVEAEKISTEEEVTQENEEAEDDEERLPATVAKRFYFEEDLESFIIDNLGQLDVGKRLTLFTDEKGTTGRQYHTDFGEIDILSLDESGNFVVIELKRDQAKFGVVGQIAKYMQWVEDNLVKTTNKKVSGIIISHRGDAALVNAVRALRFPVSVKYYDLNLKFTDP